jgi:dTDP-4-dehydrorhamnose reductase
MNNSVSILLIGNEGSFCKFIHNYLVKTGNPALVIYLKSDFDDIESINNKISYILNSNIIKTVIFVGGESQNIKKMNFANFILPKHIALFCLKFDARFIYLSSLSALGNLYRGTITPSLLAKKRPLTIYGQSKQDFDVWIQSIPKINSITKVIYPASILGKSHTNSSLQKMIKIFIKYPILGYFNFKTVITFCDRSEIAVAVTEAINPFCVQKIFVSHNLQLSILRSLLHPNLNSINVPSLIFLIDVLRFFLPKKMCLSLINCFSEAIYSDDKSPGNLVALVQLKELCAKFDIEIPFKNNQ